MYERVLVPLDGSRVAELALDHAAELARQFGSELLLLRVVYPRETASDGLDSEDGEIGLDARGTAADVIAAEEYLSGVAGKLSSEGIRTTTAVLEGEVSEQLLRKAETADARLIVMSTHGRGGLKRTGFGSVAGAVLRNSTIPLLILPYR